MKNIEALVKNVVVRIDVILGSAVKIIAAVSRKLSSRNGADSKLLVKYLVFDFTDRLPPGLVAALDFDTAGTFEPGSHYPSTIPTDRISLQKADDEGLLMFAPKDWPQNPGASLDNAGASGNPQIGAGIAEINSPKLKNAIHKKIQQAISYSQKYERVRKGAKIGTEPTRLPIRVMFSTVGATGSGSVHWFLRVLASIARQDGVEPKIILYILCRGNLSTHNTWQAKLNEVMSLKFFRAISTGAYVDSLTNQILPLLFDQVMMFSNINSYGNIDTLEKFLIHQGHLDHLIWNTPAGANMSERQVDIESHNYDEYEDPLVIHTASMSRIHLDNPRIIHYCTFRASSMLAESMLAQGDIETVISESVTLARSCGLVESEDETQITRSLTRPTELAGEIVFDRAISIIRDRTSNTKGFQKAMALVDSINSVCNNDIPLILVPLMTRQGCLNVETAKGNIDTYIRQKMRTTYGIWASFKSTELLRLTLEKSLQAITVKANESQENLQPHHEILGEASERLQQLEQRNPIARSASFLLIRRIISSLQQSSQATTSFELELAACNTAIQHFIVPLVDHLDHKRAWIGELWQRLQNIKQHCSNQAQATAQTPSTFESPGFEIVTPDFLDSEFNKHIANSGGKEEFVSQLRNVFLKKYGSFSSLIEASFEESLEILTDLCRPLFENEVGSTDTIRQFTKTCYDEHTQQQVITQMVQQSKGGLLIEGEANKPQAWIKVANVPGTEHVEWAREVLDKADRDPGKWDIAIDTDRDNFTIAQMRGGISFTPFIDRLELPDDAEGWEKAIGTAVDPLSAIMVGPNPKPRQFKRVLAKAIATDLLTTDKANNFTFISHTGDRIELGTAFKSVDCKLRPKYRQLVFIESYFGSRLVESEETLCRRLKELKLNLEQQQPLTDKRLALIDITAVSECQKQAELLAAWAARIRKSRCRRRQL